ncbi:MAG: response regulator transcription factor [Anaerolineales bacterium]|nr:response regulator transcription factor [Anaerolineales bacterium]
MKNETILIVEDDKDLNRLFSKYMAIAGFTCLSVTSVSDALRVLLNTKPAVMVLDLGLEDGAGNAILDYLQTKGNTETRVIVVSGRAFTSKDNLGPYQVDQILMKPVSPRALSSLARSMIAIA